MGRLFARRVNEREQRDELLSAYLDGQLSAGERARLETQLGADPALRAELESLRHTVALVRDLPPVPIPRNFILSPAMAARLRPVRPLPPRRAWAAPLLTAATAVVSLLFVVVLAADLLLSGMGGQAFAPAAEPLLEAEAPQAALAPSPASEQVEVEVVVEAEAEEETVAEEVAGEEEVEKAVPAATAPAAAAMEAPAEAPAETTAEVEADYAETPEGTESPVPAMGGGAEPTPSDVGEVAARPIEEEAPAATRGAEEAPAHDVPAAAAIPPQWTLEAILGLTALGLAVATVWAWRARRR
jgi:anti-sigma factor RsiW